MKYPESPDSISPWARAKRKAGLTAEPERAEFDLGDFDTLVAAMKGD